jgi:hypothetical protein
MSHNIYVTSGDDYLGTRRLTISATDGGSAVDLTGVELTFRVQRRRSDHVALVEKTEADGIEIASPQTGDTKGVAYIELEAADTDDLEGNYRWELQGIDATGVITLGSGGFYVAGDIVHP